MFVARFPSKSAADLKRAITVMGALLTDVTFDVSPTGINVTCMDVSRVALIAWFLPAATIGKDFRCRGGLALGINLANLIKILRCAKSGAELTLSAGDEKAEGPPDELFVTIESANVRNAQRYKLPLMQLDVENMGIPSDLPRTFIVKMPSHAFKTMCDNFHMMGALTVGIEVSKENVKMIMEGEALATGGQNVLCPYESEDNPDESVIITLQDEDMKRLKRSFALRYLVDFSKASALSPVVTLILCNDGPLRAIFETPVGKLTYFLAPKIDDEEEEEAEDSETEPHVKPEPE